MLNKASINILLLELLGVIVAVNPVISLVAFVTVVTVFAVSVTACNVLNS